MNPSAAATRIERLAVAGVLAVWLALLVGLLGRHAWPLDLFAHFRVQYTVLLVVFAIALASVGRRGLAMFSLAGALVSAIPVLGYLGPPTRAAEAARPGNFRLVSFNIWLRNGDYARAAEFLERADADAIVLQELTKQQGIELHALLPSYPHSYIEPGRPGAVVFSRWPLMAADSVALSDKGARAARVVLDWDDASVTLLGVHLHWPLAHRSARLRNEELKGLASLAASLQGPVLVTGDFNVTPWSVHFRDALDRSGMSDCAVGKGIAPSWPSYLPLIGIRIDHCLASRHWRSVDVHTGPHLGSDHRPLIADLQLAHAGPEAISPPARRAE